MNARNLEFIGRYNRRSLYPLVDNKLSTKHLAQDHKLSTPALHLASSEQHEVAGAVDLLGTLDGFAIKPAKGSGGKGIWVITGRDDSDFVKSSGAIMTDSDLRRHMSNILAGLYSLGGGVDSVIIEDLMRLDPRFQGLSHEGIPDIRIVVFQGYPVMAMLRLATHASDGKANLHQGAIGVGLNIADGTFAGAVQFGRPIERHPDTEKELSTIQIDAWPVILELAAQCFDMTGLGYLGTDIVIDRDRGPMLLELNARPGLAIQIANNRGLIPRLRHIDGMKNRQYLPAADRVYYAMEKLAFI